MLKTNVIIRQHISEFCKKNRNIKVSVGYLILLDYLFEVTENNYNNGEIDISSHVAMYRGVSKINTYNSLASAIKRLAGKGVISLLDRKTDKEAFYILNKTNSKVGCLFCGKIDFFHQHHYPVRSKDNGTETIRLCTECHFRFHKITDYELKVKINWDFIGSTANEYRKEEVN